MTTPSRRDLANAIRFLAIDAVEAAKSGHPGMPMGMADIAEVLWNDFLRHNPNNPKWFNRDRFVLSNGHGSMLQYALLHLTGYDLPLDELKHFRQLHSQDRRATPEVHDARRGNHHRPARPGLRQCGRHGAGREAAGAALQPPRATTIVDHHTWVFMGDGCLMEGISHEAALAGRHLGPGQAGRVLGRQQHLHRRQRRRLVHRRHPGALRGLWLAGDPRRRRPRCRCEIKTAIETALKADRQADADLLPHHDRLRRARTRRARNPRTARRWARTKSPRRAQRWTGRTRRSRFPQESTPAGAPATPARVREDQWNTLFDAYAAQLSRNCAAELVRRSHGELPEDFAAAADAYIAQAAGRRPDVASRKASQMAIEAFAPLLPELIGGSADLAHSNLTLVEGQQVGRQRRPRRQLRLLRRARIRA